MKRASFLRESKMGAVLRELSATVAGISVAFIFVIAVEFYSAVVHPFPPDFGGTVEEVYQHVERYPPWVLASVVPAWAGAAFASIWIAGRLGGRGGPVVIGLLLVAALVCNISMLPYPVWFKVASLMAIPSAIVACFYWRRRPSPCHSIGQAK